MKNLALLVLSLLNPRRLGAAHLEERDVDGTFFGTFFVASFHPSVLPWPLVLACMSILPSMAARGQVAEGPIARTRPNVLFIAIDDLRPALGCYGDPVAITPHIDRLARLSTVFQQAHCQQALCAPSRLSLMTGRRPDTTRVWDLETHFREALPDVVTLSQHFKNHGYQTLSIGKIYHDGGVPAKDPPSWSLPPLLDTSREPHLRYALPENLQGTGLKQSAAEAAAVPDSTYLDGVVCDRALDAMATLHAAGQPFFLGVGFRKPHLPFCAPQKYWDVYQRDEIPLPESDRHPNGAPELAVRSWGELEGYTDVPNNSQLSLPEIRRLRHGYYACVSYVDALVGRLLDQLEQLEISDNTLVVLWGDHGFHLGEQGLWTKSNNYEWSTRVPLIVSAAGRAPVGTTTDGLVELVDIYPSLAEWCGLEIPQGLEGISFVPLMMNPDLPWKKAVFSQSPRGAHTNRNQGRGDVMGYAIRTPRYRYVEWRDVQSSQVLFRELYDHRTDRREMNNVAELPQQQPAVANLSQQLRAGWQDAMPAPPGT